jgi:ferric-dicitrate binding protein FerR (iron transport regulator)
MALLIPGLDADLLAKVRNGDLGALEKLFRAAYPLLLVKAHEVLADDTAAARVVERLFPRLFAERAALTTPDALNQMLDANVHEAAVRERSRLAGIRKRDDGGVKTSAAAPSADDVWKRIATTIQGPSAEAVAQASQMKDKLRHEAGGHIREMTKTTPWYIRAGAGAALLAVVAVVLFVFSKSGEKGRLQRQVAGLDVRDLKTGTGQRGNVTMDDGTTAMFGAETRVVVPTEFLKTQRGVGLTGAAEFKVKQETSFPFQVLARNVIVTATGAEQFAVRTYPTDSGVTVRAKEGSVKVEVQEPVASEHTLNAGQALFIKSDGSTSQPTDAQMSEALGYLDGSFSVDNKSLRHTLAEIKKWYGTELFLKDTTMGSKVVSLTAPLTSSTEAIKAVETASGLAFGWEGKTMVLKEPEPVKPAGRRR